MSKGGGGWTSKFLEAAEEATEATATAAAAAAAAATAAGYLATTCLATQ